MPDTGGDNLLVVTMLENVSKLFDDDPVNVSVKMEVTGKVVFCVEMLGPVSNEPELNAVWVF